MTILGRNFTIVLEIRIYALQMSSKPHNTPPKPSAGEATQQNATRQDFKWTAIFK